MVAMYTVAGRQIGSHYLAIATLTITGLGAWASMGGKKTEAQKAPPTNSKSEDEEKFIQEFIRSAEQESQKAEAKH